MGNKVQPSGDPVTETIKPLQGLLLIAVREEWKDSAWAIRRVINQIENTTF